MPQLPTYLSITGGLVHLYLLIKLCLHVTIYLLPSSLHQYLTSPSDHEAWALITGSTAGIGFGFAQELCANGFNVIIHGKTAHELADAKAQLRKSFPSRSIRTYLFDASAPTTDLASSLSPVLQDISLRVLVNNVGGQYGQTRCTYQPLIDYTSEEVRRVMNVNAHFMTQITRLLLPRLSAGGPRAPSLVLNISSLAAAGFPYVSVYASCKAFINAFTCALHAEMRAESKSVTVLGIVCGNVQSEGHRLVEGWLIPTSRGMARAALRRVGPAPGTRSKLGRGLVGCGPAVVTAYWPHALQAWGFELLPEMAREWMSIGIFKGLKDGGEEEERKRK